MKFNYKALCLAIAAASLAGCSEDVMDDINKNLNNTTDAPAKFIITDVMTSTAFSVTSGDLNLYSGVYIEHETGTHNQFLQAETRIAAGLASVVNNSWNGAYTTLKNAKLVVEKTSMESGVDAGNYVTRGVGRLFVAYNLAILTDMFGDTPWTEACDISITLTPKLDKQEAIYKDILANIDGAIEDLKKADNSEMADQDLIYKGDASKWLKTAYALKARYIMHTMKRSSNLNGDMETVLDCLSKSFTSADEQCSYAMYGVGININPHFGVFWDRVGTAASKSMFDKLVARKDPRIRRSYFDYNTTGNIIESATDSLLNLPVSGKVEQSQGVYTSSLCSAAETAPTHIISYHETLFLKAEALVRLGRKDEAKETLEEAVKAAMANAEVVAKNAITSPTYAQYGYMSNPTPEITAEEVQTYFDTEVAPLFDANPLKETMIQKYIAFWNANGESTEAYNDVRRMKAMGQDVYELANKAKFPLRFPYGNEDTTTNPFVKEAYGDGQYVFSENVWWAGGNR